MTLDPQLEDRLRAALRRPQNTSWPEGDGAFDQFLRRHTRRGRALAARGALALVVVVGPGRRHPPAAAQPPGRSGDPADHGPAAPDARRRFEVLVPVGWTD